MLLAGIVVASDNASPLALPFIGEGFRPWAVGSGTLIFALLTLWLYRRNARAAAASPAA